MRTTRSSRAQVRPAAESDRERAWAHFLENPGGVRKVPDHAPYDARQLIEIARRYDRICSRARGRHLQPDVDETDVLAALLVVRTLRDKLDNDELLLITLARSKGVTWARVAEALEMSGRQSAERRHLQLSRAHPRPDGSEPRTQSERVEDVRERRSRRAEREWALEHADRIRSAATALASIEDLQERADRSQEAVLLSAPVRHDSPTSRPVTMAWPAALMECLAEDETFRSRHSQVLESEGHADEEWQRSHRKADIVHRMLGLLSYASIPRHIDLSDNPQLVTTLAELCDEATLHNGR
ncbi:hypothetical protein AB0R12_09735 [Streptomyces niveus]|uniref:hypothetical protein n=1 Tax=Streptomyces niveus TaxID=193462 RepID=UPI00343A6A95